MSFELARSILSASDDERLELIFEHEEALVWDEYGDEVEQFNRILTLYPGIPAAQIDRSGEERRISYRNAKVTVPVKCDRQDNLRALLALAGLTREDLAFRMCVDTDGNSEFGFLMLPPEQWISLENEFGAKAVRRRFLPVGESCEQLFAMLAEDEHPWSRLTLLAQAFAQKVRVFLNRLR